MNDRALIRRILVSLAIPAICISAGCNDDSGGGQSLRGQQGVMSGPIDQVIDSVGIFTWGDSINHLCQQWSIAEFEKSGWFYGTGSPWSSADVYVLVAPDDPLDVVAAENFDYTNGSVTAQEGDTVFFRGRNGFFGAWTIDSIEGGMGAALSGTWYFKAGGGGDFTAPIIGGGRSNFDTVEGVCDRF